MQFFSKVSLCVEKQSLKQSEKTGRHLPGNSRWQGKQGKLAKLKFKKV
jgi:hypothetical protein